MSQAPRPKFFCEACGAEVRQKDKICPNCGKFFASVKCPSCGFTGDSPMFRDGCPSCGYAVFAPGDGRTRADKKKRRGGTDPLPAWMYALSLLLLAALIAFIVIRQ